MRLFHKCFQQIDSQNIKTTPIVTKDERRLWSQSPGIFGYNLVEFLKKNHDVSIAFNKSILLQLSPKTLQNLSFALSFHSYCSDLSCKMYM